MANTVDECRQMIAACERAERQLMIAYRSQYEPRNLAIRKMVQDKQLGVLKEFVSTNSQAMGDPQHWRLKRALAGGGPLPDVGIYCINSIRFLSAEEPSAVWAEMDRNPSDPRFREVEESIRFVLRFASGLRATCHSSYSAHKSQFFRLLGSEAWVEMDPGYAYRDLKMRVSRVVDERQTFVEPGLPQVDQFAAEMDHVAKRIRSNQRTFSPGEEKAFRTSASSRRYTSRPAVVVGLNFDSPRVHGAGTAERVLGIRRRTTCKS